MFSWLADSLAAIAENTGWKKKRKEDLNQIKLLSNRLILSSFPSKNYKPKTKNFSPEPSLSAPHTLNTNDQQLTTNSPLGPTP